MSNIRCGPLLISLLLIGLAVTSTSFGSGESVTLQLPDGNDAGSLYLRPGGPHPVLTAALDIEAFDASGAGDRLYVAAGDDGLIIFKASPEGTPRREAQLTLDGPVTGLWIAGAIAWLTGPKGLTSVDISEPGAPAVIAHYPTPSPPVDFAIGDDAAWLLLAREILTFDLSMPGQPILIGRSGLGFHARAIAVHDNLVFLAAGEAGLVTFDRRQPPPLTSGFRPGGAANDIALADGRIYVATDDGVTIVEGAGTDGLRWLGSFRTERPVRRIAVADGRATVQTADRRLWLLDVENPEAIRITALLMRDCCNAWQHHDRHAFVLAADALTVFDIGVPAPQPGNAGLAFGQGVNLGGQRRVHIDRDIAYVADWFAGLHLYAIDDPARPRLLASLNTGGSAKGVVVRDDIAFVADDDHGLQVIDVTDPQRPRHVANLLLPGLAYTPVLDGDRLWLASHFGGLHVIDIADPGAPALIARYQIPGRTWSLRLRDGIALVAADEAGLLLLDVADPVVPRLTGSYAPGGRAEEVVIDGDRAYVAFFDDGVHIVDIGDPAQPRMLGRVTTPGNARGLDLRGTRLYVADWRAGMQIIDVSDPRRPRITGGYDTDGAAWGVQVTGDIAFVADWWGGITLLDVGDAERPAPVGHYPPRTPIESVATAGGFAFLAQGAGGLQVYDIGNPLNPTWVTGLELTEARAIVIDVAGARAHVLQDGGRVAVIDLQDPYQPRVLKALSTGHDAHGLRAGGAKILLIDDDGVTLIDTRDASMNRIETGPGTRDAWRNDAHLFVATRAGLRVFDAAGAAIPGASVLHPEPLTLVRGDDRIVLLAVRGEGLRILSTAPGFRELAHVSLAHEVTDIVFDGTTAHIATDAPGILSLDLGRPADWRLLSAHDLTRTASGLAVHDGTLYLSGTPELLALTPPRPVRIDADMPGRLVLQLPDDLPPGSWDLAAARAPLPGHVLRHDAVMIEPLRFGRPQISAGEFEALRQQHLRETQ